MITDEDLWSIAPSCELTVETTEGEQITGRFDGCFTIDAAPERGVVGIQIAQPPVTRPGFPTVVYIERERIEDVTEGARYV
jgi:hypothetical protein